MKVNAGSAVPLYRQIMDDLREQIDSGASAPGDRIPSEAELAEQYAVSRITIRRAVEELVDAGLLTKRQGKGTYVNPPKLEHKIVQDYETQDFFETCAKAGRSATMRVEGLERVRPDDETRAFLGLGPDDDVLLLRQLGLVDDVPVMLEGEYLPYGEFSFLMKSDLTHASIFSIMYEHLGRRPINRGHCLLEVVRATPEHAASLRTSVGEPLYHIDAHLFDGEDRALMVSRALIVGSLYAFNLM